MTDDCKGVCASGCGEWGVGVSVVKRVCNPLALVPLLCVSI